MTGKTVRERMGYTSCIMYVSSRALLYKYVVQREMKGKYEFACRKNKNEYIR